MMQTTTMARCVKLYKDIAEFMDENQLSPSVRDVADMLGTEHVSSAKYHLDLMRREGWIGYYANTARSLRLLKPISELPDMPVPTNIDPERLCAVPGCTEHRWLGPRGMNFKLTKCEQHQRDEWKQAKARKREAVSVTPRRSGKTTTVKKAVRRAAADGASVLQLAPSAPPSGSVKLLIVDHERNEIKRAVVPVDSTIRLSNVRGSTERLIDFYRSTGHIVVVIGEATE